MSSDLKRILGSVPAAAALYDAVRPRRPNTRYNLEQLADHLATAVDQTRPFAEKAARSRKIVLFATLHYWIEQAVIVGLALRGLGNEVTVAYLPYGSWDKDINAFDLQRQDLYTRRVLAPLRGMVETVSLLDVRPTTTLPDEMSRAIETASAFDAMYTLQTEHFDRESRLFRLRMARNRAAGLAALNFLKNSSPATVLIPNGLVTELGVFYQAARHLDLKAVTYEFNDQREQIWIAQNDIVMRQNTDALWASRSGRSLTNAERDAIAALEDARSSGRKFGKGTRFWQDEPAEGREAARKRLGLDERPVVLLATNVLGDSLTLGRNVFAASMAAWIETTVSRLALRRDIQLVVRVHPGERSTRGPSMMSVVEGAAPGHPEHIHVIDPDDKTNTYDIMEVAGLGLVYTTAVGLEMAMRGVPVIVAGETHYRDRGFTLDPSNWNEYFAMLDGFCGDPRRHRLAPEQIETAWNYAYRFFFEYPFDFPWRLMHFWKDLEVWPLRRVLANDGQEAFGRAFRCLAGKKIDW